MLFKNNIFVYFDRAKHYKNCIFGINYWRKEKAPEINFSASIERSL